MSSFIDNEAELSEGEEVSEDELELSDDDEGDKELLADGDDEADSEDEERVRNLYQKQLDSDDRRQVLLLKEQLEEKQMAHAAKRLKKYRWQTVDDMVKLGKHDDMDDFEDDADDDDGPFNDDDDDDAAMTFVTRLRPPPSDLISSLTNEASNSNSCFPSGASAHPKLDPSSSKSLVSSDISKFLFRDKETVDALSATRSEHRLKTTREDKDRMVDREIKRVLQTKSIFDKIFE